MCRHSCWVDKLSQTHARIPSDVFPLRSSELFKPRKPSLNLLVHPEVGDLKSEFLTNYPVSFAKISSVSVEDGRFMSPRSNFH